MSELLSPHPSESSTSASIPPVSLPPTPLSDISLTASSSHKIVESPIREEEDEEVYESSDDDVSHVEDGPEPDLQSDDDDDDDDDVIGPMSISFNVRSNLDNAHLARSNLDDNHPTATVDNI